MLVSAAGRPITTGYSRESDPADHAEEVALAKVAQAAGWGGGGDSGGSRGGDSGWGGGGDGSALRLEEATLYSSLEPCLRRASRPRPCAELIVAAGIRRVVLAWLEPPLFVPGGGAVRLREAGVTVIEIPELAAAAQAVNAHLLTG